MLKELAQEKADEMLKGMVIPPRPVVLLQLEHAQTEAEPDFDRITKLISSDLALSAAILKTVNSPFFSLNNRVVSVQQALHLLGLRNLGHIVRGVFLRHALSPEGEEKMERFWIHAMRVALVSAKLAEALSGVDVEEAYTYGLFQDCGMPLMQARFADYRVTLDKCEGKSLEKALELEDSRHKTNHAIAGYFLARTWYMPEYLCLAILNHQDMSVFETEEQDENWRKACNLIAIAGLAGHAVRRHYVYPEVKDWRLIEPVLLRHIGMDRAEYEDAMDRMSRLLDA